MITACKESIPTCNPVNNCKTLPGWNEYVNSYFQASLCWHKMWVDNGRPHNGVIADLHHQNRAKYHHICKMVLKCDVQIRCDKMAKALVDNDTKGFLKMPKTFRPKKASYPLRVDNAEGSEEITELFADKVFNLYNSVSYKADDMDVLKNDIDNLINTQCTQSVKCTHGTHSIIASDVSSAIKKLKHGKKDSES